ncbi:MAG: SPOR domain-containing protein [Gammaproteobacteria bacterium]|nr:SPOR domain-containing protein [Gammaproteobacteria bacterium]
MDKFARRARNGNTWISVLIFANCILWLWPLDAEEKPAEPVSLPEFQPSLRLLTDEAATQPKSLQRLDKSLQRLDKSLQPLEKTVRPPEICHAWGPFSEVTEARALEGKVVAEGVETEVFQTEIRGEPDYLVYIGSTATLEDARRILEELRSQGIDSHFITQGRFTDRLSVGVFSQKSRADKQQEKVSALGYQVIIEEWHHIQQVYYLVANFPADLVPVITPSEVCSEIAPFHQFL